jgi:uncharacterized membrane protein
MLPIATTFRSGNISAHAVDKYFGDLRDMLNNKDKFSFAGIMLLGLCFTIIIGSKVRKIIITQNTNDNDIEKHI